MAIQQDHVRYSNFNPQGLVRTTFFNFTDAGMNVYPSGPNQEPTDWLDLTNVLPATTGAFRLRWGVNTVYNTAGSSFYAVRTFAYNVAQDASNPSQTTQQDLIISTDNQHFFNLMVSSTGTSTTPLTNDLTIGSFIGTPPFSNTVAFAQPGNVGAITSRSWFYYTNGLQQYKVNFTYFNKNTNSNWGIVAPAAYIATDGATTGTAASTIVAYGGTGNGYTNPTVTLSGGLNPETASTNVNATCTAIVQNGTIVGFAMVNQGAGYAASPNVEITDSTGMGASAVAVYNSQGFITNVLCSGPIVLNEGRTYTYAWQNSLTGHTSDLASGIQIGNSTESYSGNAASVLSPALGVDGFVPSGVGYQQIFITITPVVPIDPQIDTLVLMATADGGSLDQLYGVALIPVTAPNPSVITYTDTLPDTYSDSTSTFNASLIALDGVYAQFYYGSGSGYFTATSSSPVICSQSFNSLMFNPHPTALVDGGDILANYPVESGNQQRPFQNAALTSYGTFSNNVPCGTNGTSIGQGTFLNFQMILTGSFIVSQPGSIQFTPYVDAAFMIGVSGANYLSGTQQFNGYATTPINGYPLLAGIQNNQDWHNSYVLPFTLNFPAAGTYPYEICYATFNHGEREFCLLADGDVLIPGTQGISYSGLTLLNSNLWVDTDGYGNVNGIVNNMPPPSGLLYPTLHQGRLFGTDGKSLFFSKSLDEVTTATGLITSKWEECWPGTNSIPIGLDNELIIGLKSSGTSLHIATRKAIYELQGDSPNNFNIPSSLFQETGIISNDCWTTIFSAGKPSGYVWVTPDLKVIYSDFNTFQDIGTPVYPLLMQWVSNWPYAKVNSFTYGPYNFVAISFSMYGFGPFFLMFEIGMGKWYRWNVPINGTGPLSSFVYQHPSTGYRALYFFEEIVVGQVRTYLSMFDPTSSTDTTPNNFATAIPYSMQTSWTSLNEPLATKVLNELEVLTGDTSMQISVFGAKQSADFTTPTLIKTGGFFTNPLGYYKFSLAGSASGAKFYSFKFFNTYTGFGAGSATELLDRFYG